MCPIISLFGMSPAKTQILSSYFIFPSKPHPMWTLTHLPLWGWQAISMEMKIQILTKSYHGNHCFPPVSVYKNKSTLNIWISGSYHTVTLSAGHQCPCQLQILSIHRWELSANSQRSHQDLSYFALYVGVCWLQLTLVITFSHITKFKTNQYLSKKIFVLLDI